MTFTFIHVQALLVEGSQTVMQTEEASGLISIIMPLFTEKLIKFCFKELALVYDQIWTDDLGMFIYFKILHNTAYIFNDTLIILNELLLLVLKYTLFCS